MSTCACRGVFKTYKQMSSSSQTTLLNFYKATKHTLFVEKAKVYPSDEQKLKLRLTPVGETRLPTTVLEMKVNNSPHLNLVEAVACSLLSYDGTHSADTFRVLKREMLVLLVNSYNYLVITCSLRIIFPKQKSHSFGQFICIIVVAQGICITQDVISH